MTAQEYSPTRALVGGVGIVAIAILVGLVAVVAVTFITPAKAAFAFAGLVLLLPAFLVRDPRAYGLFLLTFCVPIEIYVHTTTWLVNPFELFQEFGMPASATFGVDLYVADFVLIALVLPWLAELCRRERRLYFPNVGYLFLLYLTWALLGSLIEAPSFYLAIFGWVRDILYFLFFLYIVNNVVSAAQFRAVILALIMGLALESAVVIVFFVFDIGTEVNILHSVMSGGDTATGMAGTLPVAESGAWADVARSTGTFEHPAMTAYFLGYIVPLALGYFTAARRRRDRIVFGAIFVAGCLSLFLTFSRAGMLGLIGSIVVFFPLAWRSGLISRQTFAWCAFVAVLAAAAGTPLLIRFLETRPDALAARLELVTRAEATYLRHPIMGAGLNNISAATENSHETISTAKGSTLLVTLVHNHYLIVLIEVGAVGFLLFFGFFAGVAITALRSLRAAAMDMKGLLVGLLSAMLGLAVHNFGDPFGGHMSNAILWLFAGLVLAACRRVQAEPMLPARLGAPRIPGLRAAANSGTRSAS